MNLLLDTHTLIWVLEADPGLWSRARAAILDGGNEVFVSAASAWEIATERALGKLRAPADLPDVLRRYRFRTLPIKIEHALRWSTCRPSMRTRSTGCSSPKVDSSASPW